jgi:hypothetical protein
MAKFVPFKIDQSMTIYVNMDQVRAIWPSNLGSVLHFDKEQSVSVIEQDPQQVASKAE